MPNKKSVYRAMLLLYMALLLYLTWFPGPFRQAGGDAGINLRPFATIRRYIPMDDPADWVNIAGNLAAFAPLGFLMPRCFDRFRWRHTALIALCVSLLVDAVQYITGMGSLDVDDVPLNVMGAGAGFFLHRLREWVYHSTHYTRRIE